MNAVRVFDRGRSDGRPERRRMFLRRQVASVLAMSTLFGSGIIVATGVSATPAYASSSPNAPTAPTAYVVNEGSNTVSVIDTATSAVTPITSSTFNGPRIGADGDGIP